MSTPGRPIPVFAEETFSARKRTPFRAHYTPRSPSKSCPPVSRIARYSQPNSGTQLQFVSFKSERKTTGSGVASPHYSPTARGSYFEQCFEVIEKIGEGSFGEVFKVRSRDDGRLYAVKRCWERFRGVRDRQQKLAEVEKHETLASHPNCLRFVNAWEERGLLHIQTELCQMSLSQFTDLQERVPEARVWEILMDLLQGLAHLHSHNLGHFDIKPSNVFLGNDGYYKLGDFGLCISLDESVENAMEGDAKYMARELISRQFSKAADIFSLGISMLEIACNMELPSGGHNWHRLRDGMLPHEFTRDLSPQLTQVLSQMMHPQPKQRPTASDLLWHRKLRSSLWRVHCRRAAHKITCGLMWMVVPLYRTLLLLLSLVTPRRGQEVETVPHCPSPPFIGAADDSFSDDENIDSLAKTFLSTSASEEHQSQFNCSYVSTSPARYPGYFYSGPPIPLNFEEEDSSTEEVPGKTSPSKPSSQNSSFTGTPNSKPLLDEQVVLKSANRALNIGPKNLLEMFGDVGV